MKSLVHVIGRIFIELLVITKDDDGDVDGTKHGKFVRLFEQTTLALEEGSALRISREYVGVGQ